LGSSLPCKNYYFKLKSFYWQVDLRIFVEYQTAIVEGFVYNIVVCEADLEVQMLRVRPFVATLKTE